MSLYHAFVLLVVAIDSTEPVITGCPESMQYTVPLGLSTTIATWIEPTATDNSGSQPIVTKSHEPGSNFPVGATQVTYIFRDGSGNEATCSFAIMGKY